MTVRFSPMRIGNNKVIQLLSRPPNDEFTFSLFVDLVKPLNFEVELYYLWSNPPERLKEFLNTTQFIKPNVVIGIKDVLDMWTEFNYWTDTVTPGVALLNDTAKRYPDTNFVVFTSLENISKEKTTAPNLQFVQWGGDLLNQAEQYQSVLPVLDKNHESIRPFISLNRNSRHHRLILLSYLFGKNFQEFGHISYLSQKPMKLFDSIPWQFSDQHSRAQAVILHGFQQLCKVDLCVQDPDIYGAAVNDNVTNFEKNLRSLYQKSFVEIVSETTFSSPSFLITEKTINSMYGCNFPIILSGTHAVAHLRDMGFDMFDDIVDHSYDLEKNPFDRIISAVDNNQKLLTDVGYAKQLWANNIDRFVNNIDVANNHMLDWYQTRAASQFATIRWHA